MEFALFSRVLLLVAYMQGQCSTTVDAYVQGQAEEDSDERGRDRGEVESDAHFIAPECGSLDEEACLQKEPNCVWKRLRPETREALLLLIDQDKSGTISEAELQVIGKEYTSSVNFGDYDENSNGELDLNETISLLQASGFQGCCQKNPDPCSFQYGTDPVACTAEWLFPGCCHVAEKGCVSYQDDVASCSAPADNGQIDGSLTFSAKKDPTPEEQDFCQEIKNPEACDPEGALCTWSREEGVCHRPGQLENGAEFASLPAANGAIRGSVAEIANVGFARVDVTLGHNSQTGMVKAQYTIAIPEGRDGAAIASVLASTSSTNVKEVCLKHIQARGLSYGIEMAKMSAPGSDSGTVMAAEQASHKDPAAASHADPAVASQAYLFRVLMPSAFFFVMSAV